MTLCPLQRVIYIRIPSESQLVCFMLYRPFNVSPLNGVLGVNENMQITLEFKPATVGDHQGDLVIRYDTGEGLFTPYGHSFSEFSFSTLRTLKPPFYGY